MSLSPELTALRDEAMRTSCINWAARMRWKLSRGVDAAGPCPNCGGTDRFAIHTQKNTYLCRKCEIRGSGVIDLVMQTQHVSFVRACEIITGRSAAEPVDPQKAAQLAAEADREKARQAEAQERYREQARQAGWQIWKAGLVLHDPQAIETLRGYFRVRGLDLDLLPPGAPLKFAPALKYLEKRDRDWVTVHAGPALLAAVQRPDGHFGAVHQTWIDLDQPKGRLALDPDENGKPRPTKKVRGSKKGGSIRLLTPAHPRRIVMGEGLESTATPLCHAFEPQTAYWAGIDLGNMVGRALRDGDGKQIPDEPDMTDLDCFVPPDWCEELVFLAEGDDGDLNEAKLTRSLRRAMRLRPGLRGFIVPAPGAGQDINDLAMSAADEVER